MADVLVSTYRYSERDKEGNVTHHVLRPGDKPEGLDKDTVKELKAQRLIRSDKWLDDDGNLRSAEQVVESDDEDEEVEFPRETPGRTPSQMADTRDRAEVVKQAGPAGGDSGKDSSKSSKKDS